MDHLSTSCVCNTRQHIFSILRFAEKLSIPPSYEDIFKSSIELVFSISQTRSASISLYSHVEKCLLDRVHKTSSGAPLHFISEPCTDPTALQAYEKGRVMQSELQDPSAQDENPTFTKAYPMVSSELKFGVLTLVLDGETIDDSAYTDELLQFIANICANSITQMRLMNMLRQQAETDNLTGAANRAFFHKTLAREFALVKRYGQSLSLLYLDVDNFKQYNDSKGHPAGDKRLAEIGKSLSESVRASDLVARIGGDEFAIIMPSTSKQQAAASAKRIMKLAREGHGIVAAPGHKSPGYTLSIGIATCERGMLYKEDLIDAADRALLQAKRLGGNQSYTISIFEREELITGATNILHLP